MFLQLVVLLLLCFHFDEFVVDGAHNGHRAVGLVAWLLVAGSLFAFELSRIYVGVKHRCQRPRKNIKRAQ